MGGICTAERITQSHRLEPIKRNPFSQLHLGFSFFMIKSINCSIWKRRGNIKESVYTCLASDDKTAVHSIRHLFHFLCYVKREEREERSALYYYFRNRLKPRWDQKSVDDPTVRTWAHSRDGSLSADSSFFVNCRRFIPIFTQETIGSIDRAGESQRKWLNLWLRWRRSTWKN